MGSSGYRLWPLWPVEIGGNGLVGGKGGLVRVPVAVQTVDPQRDHVFGVLDARPGAGEFQLAPENWTGG